MLFDESDSRDAFVWAGVCGFAVAFFAEGFARGIVGAGGRQVWADVSALGAGAIVFAAVLGRGLVASARQRRRRRSGYEAIRRDLKSGVVETARFRPLEVVQVGFVEAVLEGDETDVPVYYFRTAQSEAVCLAEFLTSFEGAGKGFPNSDIELVRLPVSGVPLTAACHGEKIQHVREVSLPIGEIGDRLETVFECDFERLCSGSGGGAPAE